MSLISVRSISFTYPGAVNPAVDKITFSVEQGEYIAVLGTNGSGKSTIARLICGFLLPDSGEIVLTPGARTGIVFQAPKDQIVSGIVSRDTAFGPENLGLSPAEVEERTIESLAVTGLLDKALSRTNALSLGQTQKLALSGIIAMHPELLVMDESTAMLDPASRSEILEYLDYSHRHGQTIIHITHDRDEAARAQKIIMVDRGKILFSGSQEEFRADPELSERLFGAPLSSFSVRPQSMAETVLTAEGVSFSYEDHPVFENLSFKLNKGSLTAITGVSGSGKSTLLELLAGLLIPTAGIVKGVNRPVLAQQDTEAALFEPYAADDVAFGPRNKGVSGKRLVERVKEAMDRVGLPFSEFADRQTFLLSGGEKRKLSIAGILAMDSDIILFDEPTAGLDPKSRKQLLEELHLLTAGGKTVLFSTHRRDEADFADTELVMKNGRVSSAAELHFSITDEQPLPVQPPLEGARMLASLRKRAAAIGGGNEKKGGIVQKLPPVIKYLFFFAFFFFSLFPKNILFCTGMVFGAFFYSLLARYPLKRLLFSFLKLLPWLLFFCIFQMIFFPALPAEVRYVHLRWFLVTPSKLVLCLRTVLHTLAAFASISVFVYSTGERELLEGFSGLLKPLSVIGIRTRSLVVIVEIIFRFIPLLIDEASSIIKTQLVRGGLGTAQGLRSRIKLLLPLFIPLMVQTMKRSEALADALTARYF